MGTELRKYPRVIVKVLIDYEASDLIRMLLDYPASEAYLYDYSTNFSEGGIFIKTKKAIAKDTEIRLKFSLPNSAKLFDIRSRVVWINTIEGPVKGLGAGVGLEFIDLDKETRQEIANFIKNIE